MLELKTLRKDGTPQVERQTSLDITHGCFPTPGAPAPFILCHPSGNHKDVSPYIIKRWRGQHRTVKQWACCGILLWRDPEGRIFPFFALGHDYESPVAPPISCLTERVPEGWTAACTPLANQRVRGVYLRDILVCTRLRFTDRTPKPGYLWANKYPDKQLGRLLGVPRENTPLGRAFGGAMLQGVLQYHHPDRRFVILLRLF
jgi:hypothetical protein